MKEIIVKNNRKGNGLICVPKVGKFVSKALYAGMNMLPVAQWEQARTFGLIKKALSNGDLEEMTKSVGISKEEEKRAESILSFDDFCSNIEIGKDGILPETGGFFLVNLQGSLGSFRVKSTEEFVRLTAYKAYVEGKGGRVVEKVTAKELKDLTVEKRTELIENCFNIEVLKKLSKNKNDDVARLATAQLDKIMKFGK